MNERKVRAAADRILREAHGLFMGTGEPCRMVPADAISELVEAVKAEPDKPAEDVSNDRPAAT